MGSSQNSDSTVDRPAERKKIQLTFIVHIMAEVNTQGRVVSNSSVFLTGGMNIRLAGKRERGRSEFKKFDDRRKGLGSLAYLSVEQTFNEKGKEGAAMKEGERKRGREKWKVTTQPTKTLTPFYKTLPSRIFPQQNLYPTHLYNPTKPNPK